MIQNFDFFDRPENPQLILKKINGEGIVELQDAYEINYTINLGAPMTLTFNIPRMVNGVISLEYDRIEVKNLIEYIGLGIFIIDSTTITSDGISEYKTINCQSYESILGKKNIILSTAYLKFYDVLNKNNLNTVIGKVLELAPDWDVGTIDIDIPGYIPSGISEDTVETRYIDVSEQSIYNFLISTISPSYECVFYFDTFTKKISAKAYKNVGDDTNIYLSHDNLILSQNLTIDGSEIVTALACIGADQIGIASVNPNGTNFLYNFDYYRDSDKYISVDLKNWLDDYDIAYNDFMVGANVSTLNVNLLNFSEIVLARKVEYSNSLTVQHEIEDKKREITAKEVEIESKVIQNLNHTSETNELAILKDELIVLENELQDIEDLITLKNEDIEIITDILYFENFFATRLDLFKELNEIIYSSTYQDETFLITTSMDNYQQQDVAEKLMIQGASVLSRMSQPIMTITLSAIDFTSLIDFSSFTSELNVGDFITIECQNGIAYKLRLLTIARSFSDTNTLTLTFANRYRRQDGIFSLENLLNSSAQSSTTLNFNKTAYENWSTEGNYKNTVIDFINNGLNASVNRIRSGDDQVQIWDATGLKFRKIDQFDNNSFDPEQIWIVNNQIVFTDDGFNTAKTAIGALYNDIQETIINWDNINKEIILNDTSDFSINDFIDIKDSDGNIVLSNIEIENIIGDSLIINSSIDLDEVSWNKVLLRGTEKIGYGIIADYIIGRMIIGNNLIIENQGKTFTVDGTGATLVNADFTIVNNTNTNKIIMNADDGFLIQKSDNGSWEDIISLDSNGNAIFTGILTAAEGNFSGDITSSNISSSTIKGGEIYIGGEMTANDCTFGIDSLGNIIGLSTENDSFTVDEAGNVTIYGSLTLGGSINWLISEPIIEYEYSVDNDSWHSTQTLDDIYRREKPIGGEWGAGYQFIGQDGTSGELPAYIKSTYIDFDEVTSPSIRGNEIAVQGGAFIIKDLAGVDTYGYVGRGLGNDGYETTEGVVLAAEGTNPNDLDSIEDHYVICTNNGVRLQSGNNSLYVVSSGAYYSDDTGTYLIGGNGVPAGTTTAEAGFIKGTQIWVQDEFPSYGKAKDVFLDTNDYSSYEVLEVSTNEDIYASDPEIILASGEITLTLQIGPVAGVFKYISNAGLDIITLILGEETHFADNPLGFPCNLFPGESIYLISI